jgi:Pyruvate/2-oxoacid:ferredoxin oxidoreductase gamma subunit
MKDVKEMGWRELIEAHDNSVDAGWEKGIVETTNELAARLRGYDAMKAKAELAANTILAGAFARGGKYIGEKVLEAMQSAREAR